METAAISRANLHQAITDNRTLYRAARAVSSIPECLPVAHTDETAPPAEEAVP